MPRESPADTCDPDVAMKIATTEHRAGRFADAQRGYRTVLDLRPNNVEALYLLGVTEFQLGHIGSAVDIFTRAVERAPNMPHFHAGLGNALAEQGKRAEAASSFRRGLALKPDYYEAFAGLVDSLAEFVRQAPESGHARPSQSAATPRHSSNLSAPSISVIVCSHNDARASCIRQHYQKLLAGHNFEIILIPDARSLCEGYNRAFAQCSGEILIFSHDDIEIVSEDFADRLLERLTTNDVVGIAGTSLLDDCLWATSGWPHIHGCIVHRKREEPRFRFECFGPASGIRLQAIDGVFFAAKRKVCETIPFDEATFDGFHFYDLDFSYRAFRAGFAIGAAWNILVVHDSMGETASAWAHYAQKFRQKYQGVIPFKVAPSDARQALAIFDHMPELLAFHRLIVREFEPNP